MKYYFKQYTLPANVYIKVYYNIITNSIHLQWHCSIYIHIIMPVHSISKANKKGNITTGW